METFWYIAVAFMLIVYVILDGFDLGAGIVHLFAAKEDQERRTILNAIGPVWDGNEVWLVAAGGTLYFAFPKVYASGFSGFYLPLIMILWLLMLRGIGIEFRSHINHPMWRSFWDGIFSFASAMLTILFGTALGNIVRGVHLNPDGYFFAPLWTTFTVGPEPGILDWYTILFGLAAFFTLAVHGANFLAMKTDGEVQANSRRISAQLMWLVLASAIVTLAATAWIQPVVWQNYVADKWGVLFPILAVGSMIGMIRYRRQDRDLAAFLCSGAFILSMGSATAFGLYPKFLISTANTQQSLTAYNTAAGNYSLSVGLIWWTFGILLACAYFVYLFYSFRGKTQLPAEGEGY